MLSLVSTRRLSLGKGKTKALVVVDLSDEPHDKHDKASIVRFWVDAINTRRRDPVFASDYLYGLMPTGFDTQDMSPRKLGEENIHSLLTVGFIVGILFIACPFILTHCSRAADC